MASSRWVRGAESAAITSASVYLRLWPEGFGPTLVKFWAVFTPSTGAQLELDGPLPYYGRLLFPSEFSVIQAEGAEQGLPGLGGSSR